MDLVGQVVADRYRVIRPIAAGGMGVLFEVENTRIGRRFALKTLSSATAARPDSLARFRREAEIVARLHHPNIVAIVDWDALPGGAPFYVMELLEGEDLAARIGRGPIPWPELAQVASQAMSALAEAHRHGVLHRDLKPANVFLCRVGEGDSVHVKVLDFGLARARGNVAITNYDRPQWIGTPQYMSPEQIRGEAEPGEKADVWGMAAVLYELATGKPAFSGALDQLMKDIGNRRVVPVRVLREDAPEEFADAIESALSPKPERRITTVDELAARVRAGLGVVSESTPPPPAPRKKKASPPPEVSASSTAADLPSSRRRQRVVRRAWVRGALVGAVIAAVGMAAMFAVWGMSGDDDDERGAAATDASAARSEAEPAPPPPPQPGPLPAPVPVVVVDAAPTAVDEPPARRPPRGDQATREVSAYDSPDGATEAKQYAREGKILFDQGRFDEAAAKLKMAYEFGRDPAVLFDIAQAYRLIGSCQDAVFYYASYLRQDRDPRNRLAAERGIEECRR